MNYIELAKIMGTHGVRGDLKILLYNQESPHFKPGNVLFLRQGKDFKPYTVRSFRPGAKEQILHLEGIENREEAKLFYGQELYLPREQFLPPGENEHYVADLVGLSVFDADSGRLYGRIEQVIITGANDCYAVHDGKRELIIPAIPEVLLGFDWQARSLKVRLPEGLLEIYEN